MLNFFKSFQSIPTIAYANYAKYPYYSFSSIAKWVYAEKDSLYNVEFISAVRNLESESKSPFVILDVREYDELNLADLPTNNSKGINIPKINIPLPFLLGNPNQLEKLPKEKHIICLCHHGYRSAQATMYLSHKGYKAMNLEGGIDAISKIIESIPKY